jgi:hypothetical protein
VNKLIAICYFVLSLYGCDVGVSTLVQRTQANGSDTLYSKVFTQGGVALFECVRSASGQCHYSVFARGCAQPAAAATGDSKPAPATRCAATPVKRFAIANGSRRIIPGLQAFSVCVSAEDGAAGKHCDAPEPLAMR